MMLLHDSDLQLVLVFRVKMLFLDASVFSQLTAVIFSAGRDKRSPVRIDAGDLTNRHSGLFDTFNLCGKIEGLNISQQLLSGLIKAGDVDTEGENPFRGVPVIQPGQIGLAVPHENLAASGEGVAVQNAGEAVSGQDLKIPERTFVDSGQEEKGVTP